MLRSILAHGGESWESDSSRADQERPHLLWTRKFHYHVHKIPLLDSNLSSLLFNIICEYVFNIILPYTARSPQLISSICIYMLRPSHLHPPSLLRPTVRHQVSHPCDTRGNIMMLYS